jgi:hypothetical protein
MDTTFQFMYLFYMRSRLVVGDTKKCAPTVGALAGCAAVVLFIFREQWTASFIPASDVDAR